jgi:hypothetical protein
MPWNARDVVFTLTVWAAILLASCASLTKPWETPEVALLGLQPKELGLARQSFLVTLRIRNPNDRTLPIKAMTYRLYLEGSELVNGSSELDRQIPAFGEETVQVEVNGSLFGLLSRLPALALKNDNLEWAVAGTVTILGGLLSLPYRYSGDIDPKALLSGAIP